MEAGGSEKDAVGVGGSAWELGGGYGEGVPILG